MGKKSNKKKILPNVSIITPTFRRSKFLPLLKNNIINQKYPIEKIEWIIVDGEYDKNNNETRLIVELMQMKNDLNIVYFNHPMNDNNKIGGLRNKANELASNDILVCMDDDDYYPPRRIIDAVEGLKYGKKDLAGSSKLYCYDFDIDRVITMGPFTKNHGTNGTFAYTKKYSQENKYDETVGHGEESSFTKKFTNEMVQLNSLNCIVAFSHYSNTYNRRQIFETAYWLNGMNAENDKNYKVPSIKINKLVPKEILDNYSKVCLKNGRHKVESEYDIVFHCGCSNPRKTGIDINLVNLAKYLSSEGYDVAFFGNMEDSFKADDILFTHAKYFTASIKYKNLILYGKRTFESVIQWNIKTDNLFLYLDEIKYPDNLMKNLDKVNKIFVKSNYHKNTLKDVIPEKDHNKLNLLVDGIDTKKYDNINELREINRLFCKTENLNTLTLILTEIFPILSKINSKIELHIYCNNNNADVFQLVEKYQNVYKYDDYTYDEIIRERFRSNIELCLDDPRSLIDYKSARESFIAGCIPIFCKGGIYDELDGFKFEMNSENIANKINKIIENNHKFLIYRNNLIKSEKIITYKNMGDTFLKYLGFNINSVDEKLDSMDGIKKTYLINLKRRPSRLINFYKKYPYKINTITKVVGIDGKVLDIKMIQLISIS